MLKNLIKFLPLIAIVYLMFSYTVNASKDEDFNYPELSQTATESEKQQWKQDFMNWAEKNNMIVNLAGESTKGNVIQIAGNEVKLSTDAYIYAYVVSDEGLNHNGNNIHLPFYTIRSGDSFIMIAENTGFVVNHRIKQGDSVRFDFLKAQINGYIKGVRPIE